ncbi:hypothetical protein RJ44_08275 [Alteromonas macleodii]|uniref:HEPN domain-containing protein n=1 Tax=Alteromonas macleodii TaxID=28108 RepID=UPI0005803E6A|nr:HEPN domain-containing protein [Alteromonas macleodii]KHT59690.1 hypothetical protein RJ44_08275 [Alteromonas macleodii]
MANTQLYTDLEARLNDLRINLLPQTFDPMGNYDAKSIDLAKGYMLLVHSEIEYYIESICHKFIDLQISKYSRDKIPTECALALMTYAKLEWDVNSEESIIPNIISSNTKHTISTLLNKMLRSYNQIVNSNNGIKTKNLQKLIAPTGMIEYFPDVEMENFNSFGGNRGKLAHVSTTHIGFTIDPSDQYNKLTNNLLPALKTFDEKLVDREPNLSTVVWSDVKPGELSAA